MIQTEGVTLQKFAGGTSEVLKRWVFERSSVVLYRNVFFEPATEMIAVEHDELMFSVNGCPSDGHIYSEGPHGLSGGRLGLLSFVPRRRPFLWKWQAGCELNLCCKFLEGPAPFNGIKVGSDKDVILSIPDPMLLNLMTHLRREVEFQDIFSSGVLEGICLQISSIFERFSAKRSASTGLINRISAYMDLICRTVDGRRNSPSLHELASKLGVSPRHFARLFEKFAGMNYSSFVGLKKAELAKDMVLNSSSPIKAIAFELGFDDAASFSRAFHKWVGCSPTIFRARNK